MPGFQVKICCIQTEAELLLAREAGARFVGLVGPMPSGPGPISEKAIARIAAEAPPDMATVLLTAREDAGSIVEHVVQTGAKEMRPYGVDVCSGLRRPDGRLDRERLNDFMDRLGER